MFGKIDIYIYYINFCALMSCADLTWFLILRGFVGAVLSCAHLLLRAFVCALLSCALLLRRPKYI